MKKTIISLLILFLNFCFLTACRSEHKENTWFSEEKLAECLVAKLPTIDKDYVNKDDADIYVSFTSKEREHYINEIYEYLKSQELKYLGTRGEQVMMLAGTLTTYYFEPVTELLEFNVNGTYKFVYSDGTLDEYDRPIFCIISINEYETKSLEYGAKNFVYNTMISLRYNSEAPLSGKYVLKEEEHEHTYEFICNEDTHQKMYTCGCPTPDIAEEHINYDADLHCDICGYMITLSQVPTNHFLRNQAGMEWIHEITTEDISEIKIITQGVGVAPGTFKDIFSSTNEDVISRIFGDYYWLDTSPISKEDGQVDGGGAVTVKFILNDGTVKEIYINNGNYQDSNGEYYELLYTPKFNEDDEYVSYYGFITYQDTGYIGQLLDGANLAVEPVLLCEILIDELEFIEVDVFPEVLPSHCIETEFGYLIFYDNTTFTFNGDDNKAYQLIGKNLDELITENEPIN